MVGLLLSLIAAVSAPSQGDPWAQIWTELEALRGGVSSEAERGALREHLLEAARSGQPDPRRELLSASLEALAGRDVTPLARRLFSLQPSPFSARELWFLADLLPPGRERARSIIGALEGPTALQRWQVFLAWNSAVDESRALRYADSTLLIQSNLHARYQAEWSALDLALTYRAIGDRGAAERVLLETIAREESAGRRPHALWEFMGMVALGFGDECRARDYLGRALALGSSEAGLVLARLELQRGRNETARRGFRALLFDQPPPDWAWRGWGMTLLPPSFTPPAARTAFNP